MNNLFVTLLSDGSSDRVLLQHLAWLLRQHLGGTATVQPQWADLRSLREKPRGLSQRIRRALELYPCDLLFVHRDAEGTDPSSRHQEVLRAVEDIEDLPALVAVVPVRMTEAWLLFDEQAVRRAAGNPRGRQPIPIPVDDAEAIADPKSLLHEALRAASGLSGRRLAKFSTSQAVHRVAEYMGDFSPLRALSAFRMLEENVIALITRQGWGSGPSSRRAAPASR